ncbi:hypothetical protein P12x_003009 [Tundrisphaera lichenicola]|uniref:hypothetical protein n=1 Tax=Tundrisphaera lichenicola TaxID=2029860 RepID=UPI003EBC0A60
MTESEWLTSDDPIAMQRALRAVWPGKEDEFVRVIHCFLLDCCRAIWPLLPMEATRRGIEVAERYLLGQATRKEFFRAEYQAEGAAFFLETYDCAPEQESPEERVERVGYQAWRKETIEARYKAEGPEAWAAHLDYEADRKARIEQMVKDLEAIPPEELRRLVRLGNEDRIDRRYLLSEAAYFADKAIVYPLSSSRGEVVDHYPIFLSARVFRRVVVRLPRPKPYARHRLS